MLAKEEFISLIDQPLQVNENHVNQLSSLLVDYPYFLTARLLKIKGLQNIDSIGYEDFLRTSAAYTPDREVLYHLLFKEKLQDNIDASEDIKKKTTASKTEGISPSLSETKEKTQENEHISDLEQQILEEAVTASLAYELDPELTPDLEKSEIKEKKSDENIKEVKTLDTSQKTSFSSWLKQLENKPFTIKEEKPSPNINDLIDRFIQTEPRISNTKKEFFSPENIAKMSLVEDPDFVTETLAKIYAKQGHLNKAINAFKKLSLKYPEKSTYFAAQIKNLEEQLNK